MVAATLSWSAPAAVSNRQVATSKGRQHAARRLIVQAASKGHDKSQEKTDTTTGIVFKPFEEVAPVLRRTEEAPRDASYARSATYKEQLEAAVNEQINVEYTISYTYHAMHAFFSRDNVSLPGMAKYFERNSEEEREHAQKFMDFQNTRGGRVKLTSIIQPESEYTHPQKTDALFAMELSLSLEKLNYDKMLNLWVMADQHGDPQATSWVEEMLTDQVDDIKKVADYVSQLRRIGNDGHGVWQFDHELYEEEVRHTAGIDGRA